MAQTSVSAVVARVSDEAFGKPLVSNSLRSMVVEAMLSLALPNGWRWCGADWAGWDLEHDDGTRLEVKQSAARQTWVSPARPARPVFDIRERTEWWEGAKWIESAGRNAHIYVFAYHPITDDTADHRDAEQWLFHVLPTGALPQGKSLSLVKLGALVSPRRYGGVTEAIETLREFGR